MLPDDDAVTRQVGEGRSESRLFRSRSQAEAAAEVRLAHAVRRIGAQQVEYTLSEVVGGRQETLLSVCGRPG